MKPVLELELGTEPIDRAAVDLVVAGFFADERPLRGAVGRADWRLCGLISEQLASQRLCGESGDAILLTTFGRLEAPRVLALGLGERAHFDREDMRDHTRDAVARAARLGVSSIALPLGVSAVQGGSAPGVAKGTPNPSGTGGTGGTGGSPGWNELARASELIELADDIISAALDELRGAGATLRVRLFVEPEDASRVGRALADTIAGSSEVIFDRGRTPSPR